MADIFIEKNKNIIDVSPSKIHGKGLFARKEFESDEVIFSTEEYQIFPKAVFASVERSVYEHILELKAIRWLNHSCSCNSQIRFNENSVMIITKKNIDIGEEITCDYYATERGIPEPFLCNCGFCKGVIIG